MVRLFPSFQIQNIASSCSLRAVVHSVQKNVQEKVPKSKNTEALQKLVQMSYFNTCQCQGSICASSSQCILSFLWWLGIKSIILLATKCSHPVLCRNQQNVPEIMWFRLRLCNHHDPHLSHCHFSNSSRSRSLKASMNFMARFLMALDSILWRQTCANCTQFTG